MSWLSALELAVRMTDLTTLEGADTPGKVAALSSKAVRPPRRSSLSASTRTPTVRPPPRMGTPIAVGLVFKLFHVGAEAVAALLMVGTITGIVVATMLNNAVLTC